MIGFVLFWPIGLALLVYMFWSKRMSCNSWGRNHHHSRHRGMGRTGNTAFDTYREETLKRLEEERDAFVQLPRPAARREGPGGVRPVHDEPSGARARLTRHGSGRPRSLGARPFPGAPDHPREDAVVVDELVLERGAGVERQHAR